MNIIRKLYTKSLKDIREAHRTKKEEKKIFTQRTKLTASYLEKYGDQPKLQIGCGPNTISDWLNTDLLYNQQVAFLDAGTKFPFADHTFQYIYAEHLFEHLDLEQEINMLEECFRILKPDGILRLALPSADFLKDILDNKLETKKYVEWTIENISGLRSVKDNILTKEDYPVYVVNNFYRDWGHQTIHNRQTLTNLIRSKGFVEITNCEVGKSNHKSLQNLERHMVSIPEELNVLETMILECRKP